MNALRVWHCAGDAASYLVPGVHPALSEPLTARELVLVSNYRASSDEGREALAHQCAFFANYNAQHAPEAGKKVIEQAASFAALAKVTRGGE